MNKLKQSILEVLGSDSPISRPMVRGWIRRSASVEIDALLYELTRDAWNRIEPHLETGETCALIQRYLLECIRQDPQGDVALTRYEAASELEAWFDGLADMEDTRDIMQEAVRDVTTLFLTGDDDVRRAIETGFLEHLLEQTSRRALFSHWAYDERLQDAWQHALAWGKAHPDFTKSLRAKVGAKSDTD